MTDSTLPEETPPVTPSSATPRRHRGLWSRLGIQSKLLAMLLGVSIVSILATGVISYRLASATLTDAARASSSPSATRGSSRSRRPSGRCG